MTLKKYCICLLLTFASLAILVSQAQAANPKSPSSASVRKSVASISPERAAIVELTSPAPGTRLFLSDFSGSYQGGETPSIGIKALISREYAIVTFYTNSQHLFTVNGAVGSADSWRLSDPSNQDISSDDPRIAQFSDAIMSLGENSFNPLVISDGPLASTASYSATVRVAGHVLYALGKGYQLCNRLNSGGQVGGFLDFIKNPSKWLEGVAKALFGKLKINCKSGMNARVAGVLQQVMPSGSTNASKALMECKRATFLRIWKNSFKASPPSEIVNGTREIIRARPCA